MEAARRHAQRARVLGDDSVTDREPKSGTLELRGEKIDIVEYSDDPATFVKNSLSPSKVVDVVVNEDEKSAEVIVPDDQLSLAIGKEGQNARLSAKLTGWRIDIKSESETKTEAAREALAGQKKEEAIKSAEEEHLCQAIKANGEQCTKKAKPGASYCGLPAHAKLVMQEEAKTESPEVAESD